MTKLILPVLMAGMLSACAGQPKKPPAIAYDSSDFQAAAVEPEAPLPVQIVEKPIPLPLPGQLQPLPTAPTGVTPDNRPPTQRVTDANKAATLEPTRSGYLNAMQVYPYTEGALYRLYAAPERVTDIALQPGEALVAVSAGDTVRWIIGDTSSGAGEASRVHVLVKPVAASLTTNLVITTDRRAYHLLLESTPQTAMASLSWTYPQDQLLALQRCLSPPACRWRTCTSVTPSPVTIRPGGRSGSLTMEPRSISSSPTAWIRAKLHPCLSSALRERHSW
ncbi:hypothetical protein GCM10011317_45920 [Niveispirillum cyanobacteriorum]|nr:hypothetical protein GCM10011317_45920 [Niveispirillum cyanobacteriorum]